MWPTENPFVAPENRPSVTSATSLPSPAPATAAVTASISGIPGEPFGPSYRMTMTSPASILPDVSASNASCSESKGRAVPVNVRRSAPAIFITLPSGASDPYRMAVPPVGWIGLPTSRTTVPSGAGGTAPAGGPDVHQVWDTPGHAVEVVQRQLHVGLPGDGQEVQHGVRRAGQGHHHGDGVLERLPGHDVAGDDALLQQTGDGDPGLSREHLAPVVDRRR